MLIFCALFTVCIALSLDKRSILGDITKDIFPSVKTSIDTGFAKIVKESVSAIETDVQEFIKQTLSWIPSQPMDVRTVIISSTD